jgi:hypothetical protein
MLTSKAQKHLDNMSEFNNKLILARIRNSPPINPFVVILGYMYFIKDERLVCVELQEKNGVFVLWFDNQIIEFNRRTGDFFIVSFSRNCWEYVCIGNHYQNEKSLHGLFYKILNGNKIPRIGGKTFHSFKLFFTSTSVFGQIERLGCSTLKVPDGCFSIHEMICGIKQFLMTQINHSFLRTPNFFKPAILDVQLNQSPLSVAGQYGVRLFLQTGFDRRLPFGMIGMISKHLMIKLIPKHLMCGGVFQRRVSMKFLEKMFGSILPKILMTFTKNPSKFREAADSSISDLLQFYQIKSTLSSPHRSSIPDCVAVMKDEAEKREAKKRDRYSIMEAEYRNQRRREEAMQEFRNGIYEAEFDFQQTIHHVSQLGKFCEGSPQRNNEFE